ncbi:MAG TPA: cupin domain-containing protein [Solirubrobacteraceae bacterium]|nr:cupin domain-containing protein [Solirubrobacteraceae bacterium]
MKQLVKRADTRTTVTPNATMTTLASPTLGATSGRSLWQVDMAAGASGPVHVFDTEQIWTLLDGRATIDIASVTHPLDTGDTIVIPGRVERQVHATTGCRMLVTGDATATASVPGETESRGTPAWIS